MRESAAIAPVLQRAAHSGLSGAQSLMSSVFGGRPGRLNQGLNQGAHQTTSGWAPHDSRRGTISEDGPEFSDDETDYGGVVVSSAIGGVHVAARGRARVAPGAADTSAKFERRRDYSSADARVAPGGCRAVDAHQQSITEGRE
jgi:hypothetical protein